MSLKAQARKRMMIVFGVMALLVLLGGGLFAYRRISVQRRYADMRRRGMEAAAAGNDALAVNLLSAYLIRYDRDADALAAFAHSRPKIELPQGEHLFETANALRQLLAMDPSRTDDWRTLMKLYYNFGMMTEANATADQLLAHISGDGEALTVKVGALMRLRRFDDALAAAKTRVAAAPDDWMTQFYVLRCMNETGKRPDEILSYAENATKPYPNDQGAMLILSVANVYAKNIEKADQYLLGAAKLPYKNKDIGFLLVQYLDENGVHREAMVVLRQIAATGDIDGRRLLLRRLWEQGGMSEAVQLMVTPASGNPAAAITDTESIGMYADALHRLGRNADAQLSDLSSRKDDLMAKAWLAIENAQSAPSTDASKAVLDACLKASDRAQKDAHLVYFQAVAEAALGETNIAIDLWSKAAKLDTTWALPLLDESQTLLNQGNLDLAGDAAAEASRRSPDQFGPAIMSSMIWYAQVEEGNNTRLGDLNSMIDEVQQRLPGEEQTLRLRAGLLARAGQTDKAAEIIRQLVKKQPPPAQRTLAALLDISRLWKLGTEQDCLAAMAQSYGQTPEIALSEAINDWKNNHFDQGEALLKQAAASATADKAPAFGQALAAYFEAAGDPRAASAWAAAADRYPNDLSLQRAVLGSKVAYGDRDLYSRTIDRVHVLLGDQSTLWKIARARWLMDGSSDAKATADAAALLQTVLSVEPESIAANVLMGQAKVRSGDMAGATAEFATVQRLDPKSTAMAMDLAQLLQYRGDFSGAAEQLQRVAADPQSTPAELSKVASMLADQGAVDKAISVLSSVAVKPDAPEPIKLEMASLYCRVKDFDHALAIIQPLMAHPDAATIVLSADISALQHEPQTAAKTLDRLKELTWPPGGLERTEADDHYFLADYAPAATLYYQAAKLDPTDATIWQSLLSCDAVLGRPADVVAHLSEALQHVPNNSNFQALQQEADLIKLAGEDQTARQCLAILVHDPSPDSPAAKTLNAIEVTQQSTELPSVILQRIQKLSVDLPRFLPAQTALIEAQLRLGRCEDAIESSNAAVQSFPNDQRPAELATVALAVFERWSQALQMAYIWKSRVIGETTDVDLKIAQIQLRMNDVPDALATLQPYLESTELSPQNKWLALLSEAQCLLQQGQTDQAAQSLWPMAQSTPQVRSEFMSFVASNLPAQQAEIWLNKMADLLSTQSNSGAQQLSLVSAWDVLCEHSGDARYRQKAQDLAAKLQQDAMVRGPATLETAMLLQESGDAKAAETTYRTALATADMPQAKNNLAMILADRDADLAEALDLAQQCVKGDSSQATYYDTLAYILGRTKNYDAAMQAIQTALRLQPDNAKWYVNSVKLLVAAGKTDQAKQMLAELDLMTPGVRSLPKNYLRDLDGLRRQLANASGTASVTP